MGAKCIAASDSKGSILVPKGFKVSKLLEYKQKKGSVVGFPGSKKISTEQLLKLFWEGHDPTQYMRQGNDVGSQYRSAVFYSDPETLELIKKTKAQYQSSLTNAGYGEIVTEIIQSQTFHYAEDYHQQYLAKNPDGYCGHGGCGVSFNHSSD